MLSMVFIMESLKKKKWVLADDLLGQDLEKIRNISGCSPLVARILRDRFGSDHRAIEDFLNPKLSNLIDPFALTDFKKAAERILHAVERKERIWIYGDFDMDGLTSAAVMEEVLLSLQAYVSIYVPDRIDEGYGLHLSALEKIASEGAGLIITVDCGIKAVEEVEYLRGKKIDCIITDHHEPGQVLPQAYAVLNPKLLPQNSEVKNLSGVGVAFKLAHSLLKLWSEQKGRRPDYDLRRCLDYVALGTIADVVPLTGENRILVRAGLKVLSATPRKGLCYVKEKAGIRGDMSSYHVGFQMAPRFNAAGRIGKVHEAYRLLVSDNVEEADTLSYKLEQYNEQRRQIQGQILSEAEEKLMACREDRIAVLEDKKWHTGIIGIVASRLAERWKRPVLLIGSEKGKRRGSGRSFGDFNLIESLEMIPEIFESFGGHKAACGFTIEEDSIQALRSFLNDHIRKLRDDIFEDRLPISARTDIAEISPETYKDLRLLEPFGFGNPRPVFLIEELKLAAVPKVLKDRHISFRFKKQGHFFPAIWFNGVDYIEDPASLNGDSLFNIVFQMDLDSFFKPPRIKLKIEDMVIEQKNT